MTGHEHEPLRYKHLQRKRIYCFSSADNLSTLGGTIQDEGAMAMPYSQPINWHNPILTPDVAKLALDEIREKKPDAVVIYRPGLCTNEKPKVMAALLPLLADLRNLGIKTLVVEPQGYNSITSASVSNCGAHIINTGDMRGLLVRLDSILDSTLARALARMMLTSTTSDAAH